MPLIDLAAVKRQISVPDVLYMVGWRAVSDLQCELRGPCPIHKSGSARSRSLAVSKEGFFCHSCKANGDAIRLYMLLTGLKLYPAVKDLCEQQGIPVPFLPALPRRARS